jgi:hypothetical protein
MGTEQWLRGLIVVYNGRGRGKRREFGRKMLRNCFCVGIVFCTECPLCLCRGWGELERDFGSLSGRVDEFKE